MPVCGMIITASAKTISASLNLKAEESWRRTVSKALIRRLLELWVLAKTDWTAQSQSWSVHISGVRRKNFETRQDPIYFLMGENYLLGRCGPSWSADQIYFLMGKKTDFLGRCGPSWRRRVWWETVVGLGNRGREGRREMAMGRQRQRCKSLSTFKSSSI